MTLAAGSPAPEVEEPRGWHQRLGVALTHRNFRILWMAALASTIGTWMQSFAQSFLIYKLTASNFYLGLDSFLGQLPILQRRGRDLAILRCRSRCEACASSREPRSDRYRRARRSRWMPG